MAILKLDHQTSMEVASRLTSKMESRKTFLFSELWFQTKKIALTPDAISDGSTITQLPVKKQWSDLGTQSSRSNLCSSSEPTQKKISWFWGIKISPKNGYKSLKFFVKKWVQETFLNPMASPKNKNLMDFPAKDLISEQLQNKICSALNSKILDSTRKFLD